MEIMKLSDCTSLLKRGVNVLKAREDSERTHFYEIKTKNIVENRILLTEDDIQDNGRKSQIQSKKLEYGDIIFPVRGTFNKAILFDLDLDLPCIVSHHFWIVRANKQYVSGYYLLFLLLSIKDKMNSDERNILGSRKEQNAADNSPIHNPYYIQLTTDTAGASMPTAVSTPIKIEALLKQDIDINDKLAQKLYINNDNSFRGVEELRSDNIDISSEMMKNLHVKSINNDSTEEFVSLSRLISTDNEINDDLKKILYLPVGRLDKPTGLKSIELLEKEKPKKPKNISISIDMLNDIDVPIIDKEEQQQMKDIYDFSQKIHQYTNKLALFNDSIGDNVINSLSKYSAKNLQSIVKGLEDSISSIENLKN